MEIEYKIGEGSSITIDVEDMVLLILINENVKKFFPKMQLINAQILSDLCSSFARLIKLMHSEDMLRNEDVLKILKGESNDDQSRNS